MNTEMVVSLAYRPFVDPIQVGVWWWLLIVPLSLGIAVVYKAVRLQVMLGYWRQVALMALQIVVGMVLLSVAAFVLVEVYARWMAERVV